MGRYGPILTNSTPGVMFSRELSTCFECNLSPVQRGFLSGITQSGVNKENIIPPTILLPGRVKVGRRTIVPVDFVVVVFTSIQCIVLEYQQP
jgi:hypothetical protein